MSPQNSPFKAELETLLNLPHQVGWLDGAVLYEFRVSRRGKDWLAILKARKENDFRVAFVSGSTWLITLTQLGKQLSDPKFRWLPDRFPPNAKWNKIELVPRS